MRVQIESLNYAPLSPTVNRQSRPEQGVRQQLGKSAVFATIGKLGSSQQKIVVKKDSFSGGKTPSMSRANTNNSAVAGAAAEAKGVDEEGEEEDGMVLMFDDLSHDESEAAQPKAAELPVIKKVLEKPVAKPVSFSLDVPDNMMVIKRKNAVRVAQSLQARGALEVAALGADGLNEKDDDESTVISAYFDRSAPPIYAKKPQMPKKRLVSKRHDDPLVSVTGKKADTSGGPSSSALKGLVDGMSKEEKLMFDLLDEAAKAKILEELKVNTWSLK